MERKKHITEYRYVDFWKLPNGNLLTKATKEARASFGRFGKELKNKSIENALYELFEDPICNGWSWVPPEQIGALTTAPILTNDGFWTEDGEDFIVVGKIWWSPNYATVDEVEEIFKGGFEWTLAEEDEGSPNSFICYRCKEEKELSEIAVRRTAGEFECLDCYSTDLEI
ncbi:MAG: hypothetical protein ACFE95_09750 [Candidatus Hodarchaeota archaeon]